MLALVCVKLSTFFVLCEHSIDYMSCYRVSNHVSTDSSPNRNSYIFGSTLGGML